VLKKPWEVRHIPSQKTGRKLPEILSPQEVAALFKATGNLSFKGQFTPAASHSLKNTVRGARITPATPAT